MIIYWKNMLQIFFNLLLVVLFVGFLYTTFTIFIEENKKETVYNNILLVNLVLAIVFCVYTFLMMYIKFIRGIENIYWVYIYDMIFNIIVISMIAGFLYTTITLFKKFKKEDYHHKKTLIITNLVLATILVLWGVMSECNDYMDSYKMLKSNLGWDIKLSRCKSCPKKKTQK